MSRPATFRKKTNKTKQTNTRVQTKRHFAAPATDEGVADSGRLLGRRDRPAESVLAVPDAVPLRAAARELQRPLSAGGILRRRRSRRHHWFIWFYSFVCWFTRRCGIA